MVYGSDESGRCDPDSLLVAKVYLVTARTSRLPKKRRFSYARVGTQAVWRSYTRNRLFCTFCTAGSFSADGRLFQVLVNQKNSNGIAAIAEIVESRVLAGTAEATGFA